MLINRENLDTLFASYNTAYQDGLHGIQAMAQWSLVAELTKSETASEVYAWLGKVPSLQEWVGERTIHNLAQHGITIRNLDHELAIGVERNHIEDDKFGVYMPIFRAMGEAVAAHPDQMVWPLLAQGFTAEGQSHDGSNFFDTEHPVITKGGATTQVSNTSSETDGPPWYLMDSRHKNKPLIFQERKTADHIVRKDREEDENVFNNRTFLYGVDCRDNAGYGRWQYIFGSRAALNAEKYNEARVNFAKMKGDHGRPLGLMADRLIVPPELESDARKLIMAERLASGASNIWHQSAEVVVVPWFE